MAAGAALALACHSSGGDADRAFQIEELPGGGVRVVSRSPVDSGRWRLSHVVDIRPSPGEPGEVLAPEDLAVADDGSVLTVEANPVLVKRYDATGQFVGTIGGTGGGPGEYRQARIAVRGDTILVADPAQDRFLRFHFDGHQFLGATAVGCCLTYYPLTVDTLGRVAGNLSFRHPEMGGRVPAWFRRLPGHDSIDSLWYDAPPLDPSGAWEILEAGQLVGRVPIPFRPQLQWAVDPGGNLIVGSLSGYELRLTGTGLDTLQLFSRPLASVPVTNTERRDFIEETVARDRRYIPEAVLRAALDPGRIPATKAVIERIWVDREGRRWVQVASAPDQPIRLDLFDGEGRWLDEVAVPRDGWPGEAWDPIAFGHDRVAVALESESGEPFIRVYRLERR